jgi:hypothetical protein
MLLSAAHMSIHVSILTLSILKTFKSSVVIITRPATTKIDANNPRLPRGFPPKNIYESAIEHDFVVCQSSCGRSICLLKAV